MIICSIGQVLNVPEFNRPIFDVALLSRVPSGPLVEERAGWSERRLECSLVRSPAVIAKMVGLRRAAHQLRAHRQVSKVDVELRAGNTLHLLELKKPDQYLEFRSAATEIVRHWVAKSEELRQDAKSVHLWAVCPVRWSRRRMAPRVPEGWAAFLESLTEVHRRDDCHATLGAVFYSVFTSQHQGQLLVLWRGGSSTSGLQAIGRQLRTA